MGGTKDTATEGRYLSSEKHRPGSSVLEVSSLSLSNSGKGALRHEYIASSAPKPESLAS